MSVAERIVSLDAAGVIAVAERAAGRRVVLANGCFDLLHVGHVRYLEGARALGDLLLVAINSDRSVRQLKGPSRPILGELARAALVASLRAVDYVFVFDTPDVREALTRLRPHVHAKGTDYRVDTVPERDTAAAVGTTVAIVGDPKDHSTQGLLARLHELRSHASAEPPCAS